MAGIKDFTAGHYEGKKQKETEFSTGLSYTSLQGILGSA